MSKLANHMINVLKNKYLPFLFAVPLFFCVYHYNGIIADAVLYITQYVHFIDPDRFLKDPIFEFGNQDSYGFFSPVLGIFIKMMGIYKGSFVFTFIVQFAWIIASVYMMNNILKQTMNRIWLLPVTIVFVAYFANGMHFSYFSFFSYVQSYVCSRTLSVVFGILAIAFMLKKKRMESLILALLGTCIHPITAGWCLPLWLFIFFPKTKIPIIVMSLVFPATCFLHIGWLDVYPDHWLPFTYPINYIFLGRYVVLFCFYFFCVRRLAKNIFIKDVSLSISLILLIALYWDYCGGFGKHVFLYATQPWRVMWIPSVMAVPLALSFFKDSLKKIIKRKYITTYDFSLALFLISFLLPHNLFFVSVTAAILFSQPSRKIQKKFFLISYICFLMMELLVQEYHVMSMQGCDFPFDYDFRYVFRIRSSLQFFLFVYSIAFILYLLREKKFISIVPLFVYLFIPQYQLLPFLSLYIFFMKKRGCAFWCGVTLIGIVVFFDGCVGDEDRFHGMINGMTSNLKTIFLLTIGSLAVVFSSKKFHYALIVIWLICCAVYALFNYDNRNEDQKKAEMQLDAYLYSPIFPQILERGKVFFYVSGRYIHEPRIQFLTGSYFTASNIIGDVFNEGHYKTVLERESLLYFRERPNYKRYSVVYEEILKKLANADTLVDRFVFLCSERELTHLVTDMDGLPFSPDDSTVINGEQKVYLYGCP